MTCRLCGADSNYQALCEECADVLDRLLDAIRYVRGKDEHDS